MIGYDFLRFWNGISKYYNDVLCLILSDGKHEFDKEMDIKRIILGIIHVPGYGHTTSFGKRRSIDHYWPS